MARPITTVLVVLVALMLCVPAFAQGTHKSKDQNEERTYVLVEFTGLDVTCTSLPSQKDVDNRVAELQRENADRAKANKAVVDEVKKLNTELAAKKRELAAAKEDAAKQEAQRAVDDVTAQIEGKKSEFKILTTWNAPKRFSKFAAAQKYIDEVYKEAQVAKERAAKKEQAEKDKAEKERAAKEKQASKND